MRIIDLFLDCLDESNEKVTKKMVSLALASLNNCCIDPRIANIIVERNSIPTILKHLYSNDINNVLNTITIMIFLCVANESSRNCM